MQQIKFSLELSTSQAEELYHIFSDIFEDEEYPICITELDEKNNIFEFSIYAPLTAKDHITKAISQISPVYLSQLKLEELPEIDWVAHSLSTLKPIEAGCFFVHGSHDQSSIDNDKISIQINANQAFGTGHHQTTHLCLQLITSHYSKSAPNYCLDLGTGSGILSIALAKLGAPHIIATDIDPLAIEIAKENFTINNVTTQIKAYVADGFSDSRLIHNVKYDLIIANILAGPLIELASDMYNHLADGGRVILSGILTDQSLKVIDVYHKVGLFCKNKLSLGDWVALEFSSNK
ncbi:50S ribosomal protein L11 methyltransferase [Bartonella sp. DGB1]|uniref:50S ribosomal protein L11 methyltransferase n=1 Tax=Bartonella sp. DGB1 TaxID=3239807 RepID=UPI00352418BA